MRERRGDEETEGKMLNQRAFWISPSALVLVLAVVGGGWVLYQGLTHWLFTTPTVLKKSGDSITVATSPNFNVSYMPADSYLSSHKNLLDTDHLSYLDKGKYANYFAVEIQYKDQSQITIQDIKINNAPSCTTPSEGPTEAEIADSVVRLEADEVLRRLEQSTDEIEIMSGVLYPKQLNFGGVFYLISKCSPWRAQIETDRGAVSYK
jgi:hypothetical protein